MQSHFMLNKYYIDFTYFLNFKGTPPIGTKIGDLGLKYNLSGVSSDLITSNSLIM